MLIINIPSLPLWCGVHKYPKKIVTHPYSLTWDSRGFLRQSSRMDVLEAVKNAYSDDAYVHMTAPPGESLWSNRRGDSHLNLIRSNCADLHGAVVMEVGAGTLYIGEKLVAEDGVSQYIAIDPSLKQKVFMPGIEIVSEYFDNNKYSDSSVDYLFSFHCLEHVPDPVYFLTELHRLIRDNGRIVLSFPDSEQSIINGDLNGFIHEHISYFTDVTARRLFALVGLIVVTFVRKGGNLSYVLAKCTKGHPENYDPDPLISGLGIRIEASVNRVTQILETSAAGPIALHGATNGLNALLYLSLSLTSGGVKENHFLLFDGDSTKTGCYLPTLNVPIRHSSDLVYRSATKVYICANSFFKEISTEILSYHPSCFWKIEPLLP
jgi:2-polyprenyl-3-methyl-5-hydroxy-6-metoxy-1,4-benzoquinol methylase